MMNTQNGRKVFIAGSRSLSRLGPKVRQRLDNIVEKELTVVVGDANGVDKAVQQYLYSRRYAHVTVFCMEDRCRNNVGGWPTRAITAKESSRRDFAYYATKDRAMVEEADYGLMLWDGESRGTLRSVLDLVRRGKPAIVYLASDEAFHTLREAADMAEMLKRVAPGVLKEITETSGEEASSFVAAAQQENNSRHR
jgi:hypothetical protein